MSRSEARPAPIFADDECFSLVESYADRHGRACVKPLSDFQPTVIGDAFVVCEPNKLGRAQLDLLVRKKHGVVGLATARNRGELHEFLDRQSRIHTVREMAFYDEVYGAAFNQGLGTGSYPDTISSDELRRTGGLLGLHVHGEGAHANLRSVVLCGQGPGSSRSLNGCGTDHCKRAGHTGGTFLRFSDLSAEEVVFLSCSGLSVAGEHYPSDTSAVLSLIGGRTFRTGICNDRTVPLSPDEVRMAFLLAASDGMRSAVLFLNELSVPRNRGAAPWFLIGDPAFAAKRETAKIQALPGSVTSSGLFRLASSDVRTAVAADRTLYVESSHDVAGLRVTDVHADATRLETGLRSLLALSMSLRLVVDELEERNLGAHEVATAAQLCAVGARRVLRLFQDWRRRSVWTSVDDTQTPLEAASRFLKLAPGRLTAALLPLLDSGIEEVIEGLSFMEDAHSESVCDRCGSETHLRRGRLFPSQGCYIISERCITCGPLVLSLTTAPMPPQYVHVDPVMYDDRVTVSSVPAVPLGWGGVSLRDKSRGATVLAVGPRPISDLLGDHDAQGEVGLDLHTARVLIVSPHRVQISRHRIARVSAGAFRGAGPSEKSA